jgi:hypothetical protein
MGVDHLKDLFKKQIPNRLRIITNMGLKSLVAGFKTRADPALISRHNISHLFMAKRRLNALEQVNHKIRMTTIEIVNVNTNWPVDTIN